MTTVTSPVPPPPPGAGTGTGKGTGGTAAADPPPHLLRWLLRIHRPALYVWSALVVLLAAALIVLGGPLTDDAAEAWRQYEACSGSATCRYDQDAILLYKDVYSYTTIALNLLPFLLAAWSGAALVGRELENGTAQLAWTLGLSPTRWLAVKLAPSAALAAAGTGLLVLLHRMAWRAGEGRISTAKPWSDLPTLHANGPTTVALTLAGLALGALTGLLWRRTLPALALGLVFTGGLRILTDLVMPHLWTTRTRVTSLVDGPSYGGIPVDSGLVTSSGAHIPDPGCGPAFAEGCADLYDRLDATGFYATYHPEGHYWPLQLTTTALVLVAAAALVVAAFVLLRRSTATTATTGRTPAYPTSTTRAREEAAA
ncbi:ABC transporter permease [Streptomyces sp. NPDC002328]|uniref:ABC transporter permease n=1 Tax=Streptomyces sp. NPDC002328 TaxID=3364642 RepID=UPI003676768B